MQSSIQLWMVCWLVEIVNENGSEFLLPFSMEEPKGCTFTVQATCTFTVQTLGV